MALKYLRDTDARFQWLGWRVAMFIALGLVCFGLLLGLLALKQGYFVSRTRLSFVAESGNGMNNGMQVRLSGFKIGVVDQVTLNDQAKVDVEMLIDDKYLKWVKPDSVALLQQDGLLGDHYIEVAGGTPGAAPIKEGGKLVFAPAMGLPEIAADLRQRTIPIIDSVHETLDYVNDPKGDIRGTLANVQAFSAELRETRKTLDQVLVNLEHVSKTELPATLVASTDAARQAQAVLNKADQVASEVAAHAPEIVAHANTAASEVAHITTTTRQAVDQAAPRLPGLVRNADALVQTGSELANGASHSWPFNKWISAPDASAPMPDSRQ
ncbi:MlaD family protein [Silvimonas sp. JCM 19000]